MPKSSKAETRGAEAHAPAGFRLARPLLGWIGPAAGPLRSLQGLPVGPYLREMCRPWFERLERSQREMEPESALTERQFLAFGEGLRRLSVNCDDIVKRGDRMMSLSTGADHGDDAISAVRELLEYPLSFVEGFAFDTAGLGAGAERTCAAVTRLLAAEPELFGALQPLAYMRTLFHIESARLTSEVFGSMDEEIERMQQALENQFGVKFAELRELRHALVGFAGLYAERTRGLSARVTAKRAMLKQSFEAMQESMQASSHLQTGILDATSGLSKDVDSMVVSMQAHDTVMQRLGHIHRGLDLLYGMYEALESGNLGAARHNLATLAAIARLEAAQVHAAREQLGGASDALIEDVGVVVKAIRNFDDDCLMMRHYGQATAGASGTIQILLDGIEDTVRLVSEAAEAARACSQPLEPVGAVVASLSEDIAQTGEHMHRLALNVQLAAVQHGAGTGLEVLAERLAGTAGEVARICENVDSAVRALAEDLRHTLEGFAATVEESGRMAELFSGHESESLHELRDATLTAFGEVGEIVVEAGQTAAGMGDVSLTRMCGEILPEIEAALEEIADQVAALAAMVGAEDLHADELQALRAQYTMQAERQVHAAAMGETGAAVEAPLVTAGGGTDLGDNVELF